ncbi:PREDICTED: uncharacterized protein LOC104738380 [Camelina sativa]|uniref:Uncharacterized protein LOC104738380 n=1 Tax=Camelina sativa TaxID=90675 RepID=A0ABM0VIT8_CAMSA|nr:PREDICTED: uncharacterized protein LOC104738380 [Camelina sativa]
MERFKRIVSKLSIADDTAISALRNALVHGSRFREDIIIHKPLTLDDALHRANRYIELDKERASRTNRAEPPTSKSTKGKEKVQDEHHEPRQHFDKEYAEKLDKGKKVQTFAVSNQAPQASSSKPWNNKQYDTAPTPQQGTETLSPPPAPTLKRNPEPAEDTNAPAPRRRINMIMGGLTTCHDSVRSIKAYQRGLEVKREWIAQSTPPTTNSEPIVFTKADAAGLTGPHNDPLVVELEIGESMVTKILIDTGSSVNVIFKDVLIQMEVDLRTAEHDVQPLTGCDGDTVMTVGTIMLPVYVGEKMHCINFAIIDKPIVYNVILGTSWLHKMKAVASTYHQCVKFPTSRGIFTLRGDPLVARTCFIIKRQQRSSRTFAISDPAEQRDGRVRPDTESVIQVNIDPSDVTC